MSDTNPALPDGAIAVPSYKTPGAFGFSVGDEVVRWWGRGPTIPRRVLAIYKMTPKGLYTVLLEESSGYRFRDGASAYRPKGWAF